MRLTLWCRAILCRWTRKGRSIRRLADKSGISYIETLRLVREVERNAVAIAEDLVTAVLAQRAALRPWPPNDYTPPAGARLAQPPR
jgi:lambda repressor-like predicted transcriptional regulator